MVSKLLGKDLMLRRAFIGVAASVLVVMVTACAAGSAVQSPDELYFAVKVEQNGRAVGAPRLLGFEGRRLFAEKWTPGAPLPDYRLLLQPHAEANGYGVWLDLELPSGHSSARFGLLHGEERTIDLDPQTKLTLLVMKVDSPEFRALMQHAAPKRRAPLDTI